MVESPGSLSRLPRLLFPWSPQPPCPPEAQVKVQLLQGTLPGSPQPVCTYGVVVTGGVPVCFVLPPDTLHRVTRTSCPHQRRQGRGTGAGRRNVSRALWPAGVRPPPLSARPRNRVCSGCRLPPTPSAPARPKNKEDGDTVEPHRP